MFESLIETFKRYFNFSGRADRKEFWLWAFTMLTISVLMIGIMAVIAINFGNTDNPVASGIFQAIITVFGAFWLIMFLPSLSVSVRRLRDAAVSPWLLLIPAALCITTFLVLFDRGLSNMDGNPPHYSDLTALLLTASTAITGIVFIALFCKPSKK